MIQRHTSFESPDCGQNNSWRTGAWQPKGLATPSSPITLESYILIYGRFDTF